MSNKELSLYLSAAKDIINLIKSAFPNDELPFKLNTKNKITGCIINTVEEKSIGLWFFTDIENWSVKYGKLESVKSFITYLLETKKIDKPKFSDSKGEPHNYNLEQLIEAFIPHSQELIIYPIVDIIQKNHSMKISTTELKDSYEKYRKERTLSTKEAIVNTPLIGFKSKIKTFTFSNEFSIVEFSDEHKNKYNDLTSFMNSYSTEEILESTHMIQWRKELPKSPTNRGDHEKNLYMLILTLRLCNSSDIVVKSSYDEPKELLSIMGCGSKWHFETSKPHQFYNTHEFKNFDLQAAKQTFEVLLKLKNLKGYINIFNVVINRYLSSLSRTTPEDSVIDLTICLESLLLANERDELKYRLSLRGAMLLDEDPMKVKKILSRMYDDRSAIVHRGELLANLKHSSDKEALSEYRIITEKILKKYILVSKDFKRISEINNKLDELCLYGGKI